MPDRDADYYQRHKDDPTEWGDAVNADSSPGSLTSIISLRLTLDQERILRQYADAIGQPLSAFIREAAIHAVPTPSASLLLSSETSVESNLGAVMLSGSDLGSDDTTWFDLNLVAEPAA